MIVQLKRNKLEIIPEDEKDIAFIEDTIEMKEEDSCLLLVRKDKLESKKEGFKAKPENKLDKLVTEGFEVWQELRKKKKKKSKKSK